MKGDDVRLFWLALGLILLVALLAIFGCATDGSVAATIPPQGDPPAPPCCGRASPLGQARLHTQPFSFLSFIQMRTNATSPARKLNLLWALELLDEMVRHSALSPSYEGSPTEEIVQRAMDTARRRREPRGIRPLREQSSIDDAVQRALLAVHTNCSALNQSLRKEAERRLRDVLEVS